MVGFSTQLFTEMFVLRHQMIKEAMRRSRTTRHEILGNAALFSFSMAVPEEFTL